MAISDLTALVVQIGEVKGVLDIMTKNCERQERHSGGLEAEIRKRPVEEARLKDRKSALEALKRNEENLQSCLQ